MLARERVHDLGVCKAVGMTPWQVVTMVTCWAITPAVAAAVIALPAGMALQSAVMHALASDQALLPPNLGTPPGSLVHVYTPAGLTLLALAGLALTVAAHLAPPHGQRCPGPRSRCTPNNRTYRHALRSQTRGASLDR